MTLQEMFSPGNMAAALRHTLSPAVLGMFPTETLEVVKEILQEGIRNADAVIARRAQRRENMRAPGGNR